MWCASRRPPLGVCLFLSLFAVPKDALAAGEAMVKAPDLPGNMTVSPPSARMKVLDRSVYDVIDTPDLQAAYTSGAASIDDVRVFHFTGIGPSSPLRAASSRPRAAKPGASTRLCLWLGL